MNQDIITTSQASITSAMNDGMSDRCSHVEADTSLAHGVLGEKDSFGPVGQEVVCKACWDASMDEMNAEKVVCQDCGKEVRRDESISWRWYDFYAPQGDEPLTICTACANTDKHRLRCLNDRKDYYEEMSYLENKDYGGHIEEINSKISDILTKKAEADKAEFEAAKAKQEAQTKYDQAHKLLVDSEDLLTNGFAVANMMELVVQTHLDKPGSKNSEYHEALVNLQKASKRIKAFW